MLGLVLLAGCAGSGDDSTGVGCARALTWQNFAAGFFASYCTSCHSINAADRHGATVGVDFDTEADIDASAVQRVLDAGTMPPGGGLTDDDRTLITEWLSCAGARSEADSEE